MRWRSGYIYFHICYALCVVSGVFSNTVRRTTRHHDAFPVVIDAAGQLSTSATNTTDAQALERANYARVMRAEYGRRRSSKEPSSLPRSLNFSSLIDQNEAPKTGLQKVKHWLTLDSSPSNTWNIANTLASAAGSLLTDITNGDWKAVAEGAWQTTFDVVNGMASLAELFIPGVGGPLVGIGISFFTSLLGGMMNSGPSPEQALYDKIIGEVRDMIDAEKLQRSVRSVRTSILALAEELEWAPEMIYLAADGDFLSCTTALCGGAGGGHCGEGAIRGSTQCGLNDRIGGAVEACKKLCKSTPSCNFATLQDEYGGCCHLYEKCLRWTSRASCSTFRKRQRGFTFAECTNEACGGSGKGYCEAPRIAVPNGCSGFDNQSCKETCALQPRCNFAIFQDEYGGCCHHTETCPSWTYRAQAVTFKKTTTITTTNMNLMVSYYLMVQHDMSTLKRTVFGDCVDDKSSQNCLGWQHDGVVMQLGVPFVETHIGVMTAVPAVDARFQEPARQRLIGLKTEYANLMWDSYDNFVENRIQLITVESSTEFMKYSMWNTRYWCAARIKDNYKLGVPSVEAGPRGWFRCSKDNGRQSSNGEYFCKEGGGCPSTGTDMAVWKAQYESRILDEAGTTATKICSLLKDCRDTTAR